MKIIITARFNESSTNTTEKKLLEKGFAIADYGKGLVKKLVAKQGGNDSVLDEVIVETLPLTGSPTGQLAAASLALAIWSGGMTRLSYLMLDTAKDRAATAWIDYVVELLNEASGQGLATRTFTMQIREDEGVVFSFNLFNHT